MVRDVWKKLMDDTHDAAVVVVDNDDDDDVDLPWTCCSWSVWKMN